MKNRSASLRPRRAIAASALSAAFAVVAPLATVSGRQANQPAPRAAGANASAGAPADSHAALREMMRGPAPDADAARKADELLARMTLEEKVGQMTQLEIGMVASGRNQEIKIDPAKLEKAVVKYGVGSILNVADQALTPERWHEIIRQIQEAAARTRLKIPVLYGIDTIHGANYVRGATLFPQPLAMAATWDPELMMKASRVAAVETRAVGIPWTFSPVLDIGRQPLWPRLYETFGEDPYLTTVMGVATVRGYEGRDLSSPPNVASCLKHYMGYGLPLSGRDRTPAWIPEIYLREYVLPPFKAAVEAGARTVMVNSGEINGVPTHVDRRVLTDILRGELGFKGVAVSDWEDIKKLVTIHRVAADEKEATRLSVLAGVDMSMVPSDYSFSDHLVALVKEGAVSQSRIDEAVRRVLILKYELGLFADPSAGGTAAAAKQVGSEESRRLSLEAARAVMTLLKNEKELLPLAKGKKILVTGPTADTLVSLNNGWTYVWQGSEESLYPQDRPTIRRAVEEKAGRANVTYVQGTRIRRAGTGPTNTTPTDTDEEVDIAAAARAARDADFVVLCLGEGSYTETPGNITDLTLPEPQLKLAEAVMAAGKPVVLVLVEGRPRLINRIADRAGAILMAYNPGNEGGQAVADVIFGDHNPGGKLPFTYPRYPNALLNYDHKSYEGQNTSFGLTPFVPQYPFGHGLSYTTFKYEGLTLGSKRLTEGDRLTITVTVTNTGRRAGSEVVQLYLRDLVASVTPPDRRLRRFAKIRLEPGQSRTLTFELAREDFSFIGHDNKPVVEPGEFEVLVGGLTEKFSLAPAR
jgi:beta-glucosidase